MEKFAAYGFNKSHAAAYGYLSYVTAYLKANYPKEWMAALMTCDSADVTRISEYIGECQSMGIAILPPDVNEAGETFSATPQGIRFAMAAIKGVGTGVVQAIIHERQRKGHFKSLYHFMKSVETGKVGKKAIELLIDAGSFDFTGWSRDALLQSVDPMYDTVSQDQKEAAKGIMSLFSLMGDTSEERFATPPDVKHKRTKLQLLLREKELLGFFLTGHPMEAYRHLLGRLSCVGLGEIPRMDNNTVFRTALIVESVQVRVSAKTQRKFAILNVSDGLDRIELPIWSDLFDEKATLLQTNQLLYAIMQIEKKEGETRVSCRWLADLTSADDAMVAECDSAFDKLKHQVNRQSKARAMQKPAASKTETITKATQAPAMTKKTVKAKTLHIEVDVDSMRLSHVLQLKKVFAQHRGEVPVMINFCANADSYATLKIDTQWGIVLNPALHAAVKEIPSVRTIKESEE
jgi:DNA polymerase-3 subunit alpha